MSFAFAGTNKTKVHIPYSFGIKDRLSNYFLVSIRLVNFPVAHLSQII